MNQWLDDLRTATGFLTRLPIAHPDGARPENFAQAQRVFPIVGACIGAAVGLFCLLLRVTGVPDLAAAALALGAGALLTGALHEDGLADVADGFGGGRDIATKLEIMRDSRLGSYGALAMLVSFAAKLSAMAAISDGFMVQSVIAAHALGRAVLPWLSISLPYARKDGLAANAGQADGTVAMISAGLALVIALVALPFASALLAAIAAGVSAVVMARLAKWQIGGQTGDVLGAAEQVAETAILVLLAARFG